MAPLARPTRPQWGSAGEGLAARVDAVDGVDGVDGADRLVAGMIAADGRPRLVAAFRARADLADLVGAGVVGVGMLFDYGAEPDHYQSLRISQGFGHELRVRDQVGGGIGSVLCDTCDLD